VAKYGPGKLVTGAPDAVATVNGRVNFDVQNYATVCDLLEERKRTVATAPLSMWTVVSGFTSPFDGRADVNADGELLLPAMAGDDIEACKRACEENGCGGFVVLNSGAGPGTGSTVTFRKQPAVVLQSNLEASSGATLYTLEVSEPPERVCPFGAWLCIEPLELTNVTRCMPCRASSESNQTLNYSNYLSRCAIDDRPETQWASTPTFHTWVPEWLEVDSGKVFALEDAHIQWGAAFATMYEIQGRVRAGCCC
jgi:hypothetical protein